jgi:hypothetical protein
MKTLKILFILLSLVTFTSHAQGPKERIKALKIAFITSELSLTTTESEKFWPVYNAYDEKQFDLKMNKMRSLKRKLHPVSLETLSDKEALSLLSQLNDIEDDLYQNRKKLITDLKSVIGPIKILKLKIAEDNFNKKLLRQYRNK